MPDHAAQRVTTPNISGAVNGILLRCNGRKRRLRPVGYPGSAVTAEKKGPS